MVHTRTVISNHDNLHMKGELGFVRQWNISRLLSGPDGITESGRKCFLGAGTQTHAGSENLVAQWEQGEREKIPTECRARGFQRASNKKLEKVA
jgi:hypothetical protein